MKANAGGIPATDSKKCKKQGRGYANVCIFIRVRCIPFRIRISREKYRFYDTFPAFIFG